MLSELRWMLETPMKSMKTKWIPVLLLSWVFHGTPLFAQDPPKLKSENVAWILALDPIPGDALLYSGRTLQGTVNAVTGVLFGAAFGGLLLGDFEDESCEGTTENVIECRLEKDINNDAKKGALILSGSVYGAMLIWDAIGGVHYTRKHNDEIRKKSTLLEKIRPTLSFSTQGFSVAVETRF